ncbi:MAG: DOMON-like domain-containing protein [Cyanobacteriota bacterium]|nr:DOMON-like domain-containing protein [Synechococcus sp. FGCU3]MEB3104415.1 DOMON-like domain-containing protein [Cyanobacteriota bacterium]
MNVSSPFKLQPFGGEAEQEALGLESLSLVGQVALERRGAATILCIDYRLVADLGDSPQALLLPAPATAPARCDGLWQHTCLEAFVADADADAYWELNMAPSGDWALYRFTGYRIGQESPPGEALSFPITRRVDGLELQLRWPLPTELTSAAELRLGITAVVEQRSGALSYWALHHPGQEADFHRRDGFSLHWPANGGFDARPPRP